MQIQLPDDPQLESRAHSAGFASVEDYVRHLIELASDETSVDVSKQGDVMKHHDLSGEQWKREFQAFLNLVEPGNPDFDDSRDSIYPVR